MAYIQSYQNKICYPFSGDKFHMRCVMQGGFTYETQTEQLTRSPDHDLIPRSDVMKMVDALEFYAEHISVNGIGHRAAKALAEFNSKHG